VKVYKLEDADQFVNVLASGFKEAAKRGLLSAAHRTISHIQTNVIPATAPMPVDRGVYKAGWRAEMTENGAIIFNDVPYAAVIENGGKAKSVRIGPAMILAITEWVIRKGIGSSTVTSKKGTTRIVKATVTEATKIAWAIAKNMQAKGLFKGKGLKVLYRAEVMIPEFIRQEVVRELQKAVFK
jgi:hypothetical protein